MVLTLVEICQQSILRTLEESNFHGKVIKDVCKYVPDHLLEPIVEILLEKGAITDAALLAFLVPSRRKVCIRQALKIRNSVLKQIGMNCPNLVS